MMIIEPRETGIPGCFELRPAASRDSRGVFLKTFHRGVFGELRLATSWAEQYYSVSNHRVLRGFHFQLPPHAHCKLIYCTSGQVLDVAVDLRIGSPTYGAHQRVELSADTGNMVYLPPGLAHGFYTRSESATLLYNVTTVYAPDCDSGIRWDSVGVDWPDQAPITSERDRSFQRLNEFRSPFEFNGRPGFSA